MYTQLIHGTILAPLLSDLSGIIDEAPVHAEPCCTTQISPSLHRFITYGDPAEHRCGTCVIHLGRSSGTWHALFMQQKAADQWDKVRARSIGCRTKTVKECESQAATGSKRKF